MSGLVAAGALGAAYIGYRLTKSPAQALEGQICLITGAGGGVGRETAVQYAKAGCHVVLWDLVEQGLVDTQYAVLKVAPQARVWTQVVDVGSSEAVYSAAKKADALVAPSFVSILVNNAGIVSGRTLLDTPDDKIRATFNVNTLANFWTCKAFLPTMLANNRGHVVTVASIAGLIGGPLMTDYSASKGAAILFQDALRKELKYLGKDGVTTSVVCPGHIKTQLFKDFQQPIFPSLEPQYVAEQIVDATRYRKAMVVMPYLADPRLTQGFLSASANDIICHTLGMDNMMGKLDLQHAEERMRLMGTSKL